MNIDINELPLLQAQTKDCLKAYSSNASYTNRLTRMKACKPLIAEYLKASSAMYTYLCNADEANNQIKDVLNRHASTMRSETKSIATFYLKYANKPMKEHEDIFQIEFRQTHKKLQQRIQAEQAHLIPEYNRLKREQLNQERTQPLT
ncbi:MAG: hypothetical protein R8M46_06405 [Ghiorsea sp.]